MTLGPLLNICTQILPTGAKSFKESLQKKLELIFAAVTNSSTFVQQYGMYMVKQY